MCDQQSLRSACAYAQSDQSLCLSLDYFVTVKLLTEHHLEFLSLKGVAQTCLSLHLSKCHIVENLMHWLNFDVTVIPLSISGGFAFVFVAQDNVSGKEYALKV